VAIRRGVGLVLFLITTAIVISTTGLLVTWLLVSREPRVAADSMLVLRVRGTLEEIEPGGVLGQLISPPTVRSVVEQLRKATVDDRIQGVVLAPSGATGLWGKIQEVRDAVLDFRQSGKPIVAYLEYGGEREYYLASACDRVFLMPGSPLDLSGLSTYELFLRGTLEKIGAYPDLMQIGEYKTAANTLTERRFTPAHREMAESLNSDLYDQLIRGIADGRRLSEADVRALVDEGPFLPEDAVRVGLVDDLAYEDQLDDRLKEADREFRRLTEDDYRRVSAGSLGLDRGPRIAVIYAVGLIVSGRSRPDSPQGPLVGSDTLVEHIRRARDDGSIRAIVLRVDSPGGSAIASDVIWREVQLARDRKPVVASMSDVAASGGYWIAMPAETIVAQPGTLTGSIGIVAGKIVTGGTFEKLGISVESVSRGRHAEMNSPVRPYNPGEREKVEEQMQSIYNSFVEKAAEARHTTPERIDAIAQGRVWTGRQAKQAGLVDELGGLQRAVALAKQRAKIDPDQEVQLVIYPPRRSLYEILADPFGGSAGPGALAGLFLRDDERRALGVMSAPLQLFRRGEPLALMPQVIGW
jgi:protease IV